MNKIVKYFQDNEVAIITDNSKFLKFLEDYLRNFSDKFIKNKKILNENGFKTWL